MTRATTRPRGPWLALAVALAAGCGGIKVGDRTLVAPVAAPDPGGAAEATAAEATSPAGVAVDDDQRSPDASRYVHAAARVGGCFVAGRAPYDRAPVSAAPVDPWQAVDGDRPRILPHAVTPGVDRGDALCDAHHDHCLLDCGWLVASHGPPFGEDVRAVDLAATADGFADAPDRPVIAYRSLPATRRNLAVGALALVATTPLDSIPDWTLGTVEAIDWSDGRLRLRGHRSSYALAGARVAVLSYRPGGKVERVGALPADALTIRPDELIGPGELAVTNDPWREVGSDGGPREADGGLPLDRASRDCGPAHDHCLRPWVWMVVDGGYAFPVRFHDGGFHAVADDHALVMRGPAYRTVPAMVANLRPGATVLTHARIDSEDDAHLRWDVHEVERVDAARGVIVLSGAGEEPIAQTRVPVVMWFPGDRASAVE